VAYPANQRLLNTSIDSASQRRRPNGALAPRNFSSAGLALAGRWTGTEKFLVSCKPSSTQALEFQSERRSYWLNTHQTRAAYRSTSRRIAT